MLTKITRRFFSNAAEAHFRTKTLPNGVVLFEMNRPKARNAISSLFVEQFSKAVDEHQESATCIILTSSTPGMFCAGADLKERKEMSQ